MFIKLKSVHSQSPQSSVHMCMKWIVLEKNRRDKIIASNIIIELPFSYLPLSETIDDYHNILRRVWIQANLESRLICAKT